MAKRWAITDRRRVKLPQFPWFDTWAEAYAAREAAARMIGFVIREDFVKEK